MSSCAAIVRAEPGTRLGPVVELDALVQPVAEHILGEDAVRADVCRKHVHVVEALHRGATADVALWLVPPRRPQVLGSLVALGFVVELEDVIVGIGEAVRGAVADVSVDPAEPAPARLDGLDPAGERLGAPCPQRDVAEPCLRRLRELQAVAQVVTPPSEEDGLPVARLLLHAEHVDEEAQALLRLRGQKLRVPDPGEVVDRLAHSTSSRRLSRSYESSPACELPALHALTFLALERGCEHLLDPPFLDDHCAVRVEHDDVAVPDGRASDLHRTADRARDTFLRSLHAYVARPDRKTEPTQLLDVSDGGVDQDCRDLAGHRLRRQEVAHEGDGRGGRHGQDEDLAGRGLRNRGMDHQVVVLCAPHRPGGTGRT